MVYTIIIHFILRKKITQLVDYQYFKALIIHNS